VAVPGAAPDGGTLIFDAVLTPQRSLSPAAARAVVVLFALMCFAVGCGFYAIGAWPVMGFMGLEVVLLWGAFRLSARSGRLVETLELTAEVLTVRRFQPSGTTREWRFQPHWLKVEVDDPGSPERRITLRSHGRRLDIGGFLTDDERASLVAALRAALARLHCVPAPAR